jgi:glutamate synthase domain-containing protein 2
MRLNKHIPLLNKNLISFYHFSIYSPLLYSDKCRATNIFQKQNSSIINWRKNMTYSKSNASAATLTKNRTKDDVSPFSGLCATCIEGCPGLCEVGLSSIRGAEVIYPQPFGSITAASQKNYPLDYSHFNILGTAVGAMGVKANSDEAVFNNVDVSIRIGKDKGIKLNMPIFVPGLGSTDVAKRHWEDLAQGAAISGTVLTIGENVVGMDDKSEIRGGQVIKSPDLANRVQTFRDWQTPDEGAIIVQENVEDSRLGVLEYAISDLGVKWVELKWGQGAKNIGGEVKVRSIEKAQKLKQKGYIVLPDPEDPQVIEDFGRNAFKEFERHSRLGMVGEESFAKRVEQLRKAGAKYLSLKTGAYRPADLARAIKFASDYEVDVLVVDGAGGGTGMSPWRMMNEWGVPTVEIESLVYQYAKRLDEQGKFVPDIVIAGGITLEDHMYKALALGAPYVKAVGMGRSSLTAAMVGKTVGRMIQDENITMPIEKYGRNADEIFVYGAGIRKKYGKDVSELTFGAVALYTYYERLKQGFRQLMCGNRKFKMEYISRNDITSLTRHAEDVSGIPFIMDCDKDEVDQILAAERAFALV